MGYSAIQHLATEASAVAGLEGVNGMLGPVCRLIGEGGRGEEVFACGDAPGVGTSFIERGMLTGWSLFMDCYVISLLEIPEVKVHT